MDTKAALEYLQSVVRDTPQNILLLQQEMWEKFSDEKKLLLTLEQIDENRKIFEAQISQRNPEWKNEEVQLEIFRIIYKKYYSADVLEKIIQSIKEYNKKFPEKTNNK